jgi:hypothetical protein
MTAIHLISFKPVATKAQVRFQASSYDICDGQRGIGTGFPQSILVCPYLHHSTNAPYSFLYHQGCVILTTGSIVR